MRYKIDDKKSQLRVYGKDKDDLFINGAAGLAELQYEEIEKKMKFVRGFKKINIKSDNTALLLRDFLNEIISLSNQKKKVYPKVKVLRFSPRSIDAHISGVEVGIFDNKVESVSLETEQVQETENNFKVIFKLNLK